MRKYDIEKLKRMNMMCDEVIPIGVSLILNEDYVVSSYGTILDFILKKDDHITFEVISSENAPDRIRITKYEKGKKEECTFDKGSKLGCTVKADIESEKFSFEIDKKHYRSTINRSIENIKDCMRFI